MPGAGMIIPTMSRATIPTRQKNCHLLASCMRMNTATGPTIHMLIRTIML
jgi:hypothetical protein